MKQIRLTQGLYALVSDSDYKALNIYKWTASLESNNKKFYAIRWLDGKKIRMHRAIMKNQLIKDPSLVVDHINHNSLDNRRSNLRVCTQRENMLATHGWLRKGDKKCKKTSRLLRP